MKIILENENGKVVMGGGLNYGFNIISVEGLGFPGKNYATVECVGKNGQETVNVHTSSRIITISGDVFIKDNNAIEKLIGVLTQDAWLTIYNGKKKRKIYTKIREFEIYNKNGGYSGFVLQVEADNPYFKDLEPTQTFVFERENLVKGEINLPCVFTRRIVGSDVENKGFGQTYPTITIYDRGKNGKVFDEKNITFINRKTGETITFEYETCDGEIVTIDFENRKAYSNLNGDIMPYLALENYLSAFYLDKGKNFIDVVNNTSREISSICNHDNYYVECL